MVGAIVAGQDHFASDRTRVRRCNPISSLRAGSADIGRDGPFGEILRTGALLPGRGPRCRPWRLAGVGMRLLHRHRESAAPIWYGVGDDTGAGAVYRGTAGAGGAMVRAAGRGGCAQGWGGVGGE